MNIQKALQYVAMAALMLVALGGASYALGGRQDEAARGDVAISQQLTDDASVDVMTSIDKALGRQTTPAQAASLGSANDRQSAGPSAPASDAAKNTAPQGNAQSVREAAGSPSGAPGTSNAQPMASAQDRKIVQTASLRLQVKEVGASFEEVGRIATGAGGFVASSNFSYAGEQQVASVTVRVPATRYQEVLGQLRALGVKVDSEASNASDVTEEYSDLSARLRNLEATEAQLLQFLGQAKNITEVLQVQDRLNNVRNEIERVKGRMALLDKLGDLATITAHLRPAAAVAKADGGTNLGTTVGEAWQASLDFLARIAAVVITIIVFGWWLPFLAVPLTIAGSRWLRSRPRPIAAVD